MYFLLGLLLAGLGLLMLLRPEMFYDLTEGWKHSGGGGPSRLYIISTRIGGAFMTLAGLCGLAGQFLC